ncbi:MAG TPA: phosphotransacetylase [Streptosporangiaceae bacterium]|jgi:phosphotransacetylase
MPPDLLRRWISALDGAAIRVVLPDGDDPRVIAAAARLAADTPVRPVLIGGFGGDGAAGAAGVPVWRVRELAADREVREVLAGAVRDGGGPPSVVVERVSDPLYLGAAAVRLGYADACVGGAARPTGDVLRAALRVLGLRPGISTLSSSFLMALPDGRVLAYGDCAVLPEPDEAQLADVAIATAGTYADLTGGDPVVALLSFSTYGSAAHPHVDRVRRATERVRAARPDLRVDGELQFDAAVVEAVGQAKASGSPVAGRANTLIFPDLAAGNIGYKITERLAGAVALGPLLQGLTAPMNDLSRGCSADDVFTVAVITAAQAAARTPAT